MELRELRNLSAPAKLNLYLHVTGRRQDGYHELESVFDRIDWADSLDFRLKDTPDISFEIRGGSADLQKLPPSDNLCVRAAKALRGFVNQPSLGAHITLTKQLPSGAGLGGGSSDAATTLIGLNRLWALQLSNLELRRIAVQLGADVPFFLLGSSAYATGIGEKLKKIDLPKLFYVVIYPGIGVPTPSIFRDEKLTRNTKPVRILGSLPRVSGAVVSLAGRNDLQPVAVRHHPQVGQATDLLNQAINDTLSTEAATCASGRMTGSGSAVFAAFNNAEDAAQVAEACKQLCKQQIPKRQRTQWLIKSCAQVQ